MKDDRPLFPEAVFPEGIYYNLPHENAPNFVKGSLSINVDKLKLFLDSVPENTIRLDCLESKKGNGYLKIVKQDKKYSYKEQEVKQETPIDSSFNISKNTGDDDLPF